jgi:hypothetical protein
VIVVCPANASKNVTINVNITATFSEAMNQSTINTTTFILKNGTIPVSGIVTYSGLTAAFHSVSNLNLNTTYTAIITTKVKNLSGIGLAANYTWNFTTTIKAASNPAEVNLGTAGDFVILAKTGISTTGITSITGDIGISPAAATYITGFNLIMDSSNQWSTSALVTGKVYASDYATPTPAKMTTAVNDMETAYTDAAGRTIPDYTELYAGDVTGQTLNHGLYKWGTGVIISAGGVTISGSATDVWIFQIAGGLTVANGAIVTLNGGALAKNIFWQVAGQATIGTTAAMKGIILCQTQIAMNTGASLEGRALAQTAVTLDANTVYTPGIVVPEMQGMQGLIIAIFMILPICGIIMYQRRTRKNN